MSTYRIEFSVSNAYEVRIEASSPEEAQRKFDEMYAVDYEEMPGSEFVECDHTIHHVAKED